jgi:Protein of unknown function (DUF2950)
MTSTLHSAVSHLSAESHRTHVPARLAAAAAALLVCAMASAASAQQSFKTPDEAASALMTAAKSGDRKALLTVLGPGAADIVSSGDAVADQDVRKEFITAYDEKHQINPDGDGAILIIGRDDFPFPIPLARTGDTWRFDTQAGRTEILSRRIGRNELAAIQASLAYVDAQNDYADKDRVGPGVYAQRIVSQPGKKDGLYWPAAPDEEESPLGDLVAGAAAKGYRVGGARAPFHGYYFKILSRQGPAAPGGSLDYVVKGKMIGGFALVAYPSEYRNSGVMTFIVSHAGTVYEKDLGPRTAQVAESMTAFNPDQSWKKVDTSEMK